MFLMVALVGVLLVVVVMMCYRLWKLRQVGGTAAILRDVPAIGGHGWRHGVMRYRGGEAGFYRLSSIRWWPDRTLSRRGLEIVSRRAPRGDEFNEALPALNSFVLPGGSPLSALLHVARTVARRAERSAWVAVEIHGESISVLPAKYLNRLSDLLFILSRAANPDGDVLWQPGGPATG